ncbi:GAF domain-containing protein [Salinigranum marinum]|uniref:GAF domain-containing protein n=1 Tax=Salinigranum marinum TaxID=1515595 RepID=UPI002989EE92|nr:GAF domain-containing protein [Salinigranum marinum]
MSNETEQSTTHTAPPSVRLVGADPAGTAATLIARGVVVTNATARDADPDSAPDHNNADADADVTVDCLVVDAAGPSDWPADATADCDGTDGVPTILYAPGPGVVSDRRRFEGYARRGDVDALCEQIRWVTGCDGWTGARTDRERGTAGGGDGNADDGNADDGNADHDDDRLATLHQGTVSLIEAATAAELFERTVDIASRLLDFDSCYIAVAEDGLLTKRAGVGDVADDPLPIDHGLVGETYRTATTHLVRDTQAEPRADPIRPTHRSGIAVPLGGVGVFVVIADEPGAFDDRDRDLAELLVRYAEGTLARIRSAAAIRERRELIENLHEGTAALAVVGTIQAAAEVAVELAERILSFDICYVGVREGDVVVPYAVSSGAPPDAARRMHVSEGLVGKTIRTGEPQLVDRVADSESEPVRDEYRSGISVPLGDAGVFQAVSCEEHAFDEGDLELAELLAGHVTETFSRLRAEADLVDQRERIARLHGHTVRLVGCHDVPELYAETVETARSVLGFDTAYVFVADGDRLVPVAQATHADHDPIDAIPLDHGVAGETYRTGTARLVRDFDTSETAVPHQAASGGGISVPLGDDAVFQAVSCDPDAFGAADLELAELLVSHVTATRERLRAEAELRGERDRLGALFENVPDAAVSYELVDDEPYVRAVNPAFERVFGFTSEELVGRNLDDYIVPPAGEEARAATRLNARLKSGESIRTECRRWTTDGVRTFILQVIPLELGRENVAGYAIYTDITERQERERELRRQNERLEEFANIVSHDLRNPLSIATGYLDLAAESGDLEAFDRVAEAHDRMGRLIEDLLSLARKGQVVGEMRSLDVATVATQAWAGVDTGRATLELPESLPADGDEGRLIELFENLFRNAVEHGSTGNPTAQQSGDIVEHGPTSSRPEADDAAEHGPTGDRTETDDDVGAGLTVRVEPLGEPDGGIEGFAVEDDGAGIPAERRESILVPGETTSDAGIGYGLSIVNRIVEAHGWSLSVTDGVDGGARFEIRF